MSTLLDRIAVRAAARQYEKAVERHFEKAHELLREGDPDKAEDVAKAAVALRMDVRYELTVRE